MPIIPLSNYDPGPTPRPSSPPLWSLYQSQNPIIAGNLPPTGHSPYVPQNSGQPFADLYNPNHTSIFQPRPVPSTYIPQAPQQPSPVQNRTMPVPNPRAPMSNPQPMPNWQPPQNTPQPVPNPVQSLMQNDVTYNTLMRYYDDMLRRPLPQGPAAPERMDPQLLQGNINPAFEDNPEYLNPVFEQFDGQRPEFLSPELLAYAQDPQVAHSIELLKQLAETGGYSEGDISNLRARAVSPVRSIYANAQRNVDRQRSLQGGYSPSYNSATAKMARESSDMIGNALINANAGIAENVAAGKRSLAPIYENAVSAQQREREGIEASNAAAKMRTSEINQNLRNEYLARQNSVNQRNAEAARRAQEINSANRSGVIQRNTDARNRAMELNSSRELANTNITNQNNTNYQNQLDSYNRMIMEANRTNTEIPLQILQQMQSLYGTTPRRTEVFGNQVMGS